MDGATAACRKPCLPDFFVGTKPPTSHVRVTIGCVYLVQHDAFKGLKTHCESLGNNVLKRLKTKTNPQSAMQKSRRSFCLWPENRGSVFAFFFVRSTCYTIDCLGTYFTHAQTCNVTRVQSATQSTASGQTFHMPKPVITFVFKCYAIDCFGTYFTHAQTCNNVRVQMLRNRLLRYILYTCPSL